MKIHPGRHLAAAAAVALTVIVTGGWMLQSTAAKESRAGERFDEVVRLVAERYVDELDRARLYDMAIEGLLAELDPHTRFLGPEEYAAFRLDALGEYAGIGAQVGLRGDRVTVIVPLPDSPAERSGLRTGDRIVAVDGVPTLGWSLQEVVRHLRGASGTLVTLRVERQGTDGTVEVSLTREEIVLQPVASAYMQDDAVGYVDLVGFGSTTTSELRAALDRLVEEGARGIILDLRRNPGGLMDEGITVADLFLARGSPVAEIRGRTPATTQRFLARTADRYRDLPLAVLVGGGSASASEIVAGAIQDHDRGLVVGDTTFGKGLAQTMLAVDADHWLVLTTARWYTPSGRSIQAERSDDGREGTAGGLAPDLVVRPDTLRGDERRFVEAVVASGLSRYLAVRLDFALDHLASHPELARDFPVTPAMLDAFADDLAEAGLAVRQEEYEAAAEWVAFGIADDIARAAWGEEERRRRQNARDPQALAAREWLIARSAVPDLVAPNRTPS